MIVAKKVLNPQMGVPVCNDSGAERTYSYSYKCSFAALLSLLQLPIASVLVQS